MKNIPIAVVLTENLRHLRFKHGLSMSEVAAKLNITYQNYRNYELGKSRLPRELEFEIAKIYGLPTTDVLYQKL